MVDIKSLTLPELQEEMEKLGEKNLPGKADLWMDA